MLLFHHGDRFGDHGWWGGFLGTFLPMLLFLILIGVGVWVLLRVTGRGGAMSAAAAPVERPDGALEELRGRYARGEVDRDDFLQRSQDLGVARPDS